MWWSYLWNSQTATAEPILYNGRNCLSILGLKLMSICSHVPCKMKYVLDIMMHDINVTCLQSGCMCLVYIRITRDFETNFTNSGYVNNSNLVKNMLHKKTTGVVFTKLWPDSDLDSDKVYSTNTDTCTISGLHMFHNYTNNNIVLRHNEL